MKNWYVIVVLLVGGAHSYAQNTLRGYVAPQKKGEQAREITLIRLVPGEEAANGVVVARTLPEENGFFVFDDSVFTKQDELYQVRIGGSSGGQKMLDTTINEFRTFILTNQDRVRFSYQNPSAPEYYNSNMADKEWEKLKKYEAAITGEEKFDPNTYRNQTRNYTKDSLQILLVKLHSIKTLDQRQLLERDIEENADFYLDLLQKLQASDLDPASYAYLENKIRATHQEILGRKYRLSLVLNFFGLSGVVGLLFVVFRRRDKSETTPPVALSRQEETIKNLILLGKTNKEIAAELFISLSTVKTHTSNIYSKLNISSRKELKSKHEIHTGTST